MLYGATDIMQGAFGVNTDTSKLRNDEFWAVENVSFELKKGETLGVIGPNGSGKTTLLKMLNGIFMPDKGSIVVRGRVGALIQVGAGFHPMLSGRENIYINGSILGMSKKEIDKKFDAIIEFADIGDFLDAPVKHYSSGMYVRLGFAIAVHCEPDILLVDEILAVGDVKFQSKCMDFMSNTVLKRGCSVILISHNRYAIQDVCERTMYIKRGKMEKIGPTLEVVEQYLDDMNQEDSGTKKDENSFSASEIGGITSVDFLDENEEVQKKFQSGQKMIIRFHYDFKRKVEKPSMAITFNHIDQRYSVVSKTDYVFHLHSGYEGMDIDVLEGEGYFEVVVDKIYIPVGLYKTFSYCFIDNFMNLIQKDENAGEIEIVWLDHSPRRSLIELPHSWDLIKSK